MSSGGCLANFCDGLLNIDHMSFQGNIRFYLYPCSVMILAGGDHVLIARQDLVTRERQLQAYRRATELLRMNKITLTFRVSQCCLRSLPEGCSTLGSKKFPSRSTSCPVGLGAEGSSSSRLCLMVQFFCRTSGNSNSFQFR